MRVMCYNGIITLNEVRWVGPKCRLLGSFLFFGRAGNTDHHSLTYVGTLIRRWSSVASATLDSYYLYSNASQLALSRGDDARVMGFPLRCLVNSTVGEIGIWSRRVY